MNLLSLATGRQNRPFFKYLQTGLRALNVSSVSLLIAVLCCLGLAVANAQEVTAVEVLDVVPSNPTKGSATQSVESQEELRKKAKERKKQLKAERKKLKKQSREDLQQLAKKGKRGAQLALAENFVKEATNESITVISANDALGDAVYWYSVAAQRGVPGSPSVDKDLPQLPMRSIRGQN